MNDSAPIIPPDTEDRRYEQRNILRQITKQKTQALLHDTMEGKHQTSESSKPPEHILTPDNLPPHDTLSMRTIFRQVFTNNALWFATLLLLYGVIALLSILLTISIGRVITHHATYLDISALAQLALFLISISVGIGVLSLIRTVIFVKYEVRVLYQVQSIIMKRLFSLPVSFFEQYATGDLCHRVLMIESLARLCGQHQIGVLLSFAFSSISFLIMLYFSWQLTLTTLAIVSVYLVISIINIKKQLPHIEKYMSNSGDTAAFTFQMNHGMSRIKVFCSDVFAEATWATLYSDARQKLSHIYRHGVWRFTMTNNIFLFTLILVFFLMTRWEHNQLPLEQHVIFYTAFMQFMSALVYFSMQWNELAFSLCAFRRLQPIFKARSENNSDPGDTASSELTGAIVISNVHFRYPHAKLLILHGLTCSVAQGEHLAIVGLSGAGKSTLLKLLLGFYFPQQGRISFDGIDTQDFNGSALRQQIGVVFQDSKLITGTLLTNIVDGCAGMTEADAWRAAQLVGLSDFITSLPMKMHTLVSQQINVLSGGQKQLILIARALVGKPRILLLDEATNSLDPSLQHHVAKVIRRLPITCISIAHRLSTIQYADKIMVLHEGRMIEEGTYQQLLQAEGLFYQLIKQQTMLLHDLTVTQKLHSKRQENTVI